MIDERGDTYNEHADRLAKEAVESRSKGLSGKSGYTGEQFTDTIITERKAGEGHKFTVNPEKRDYHEYATEVINQIMEHAEDTGRTSPKEYTLKVLAEALHQIV